MEDYETVQHRISLELAQLAVRNATIRLDTMMANGTRRQQVMAEQLVRLEDIAAWLAGDPKAHLSQPQQRFCEHWVAIDDKMRFRQTMVAANTPAVLCLPLPKSPPGNVR